MDHRDTCFRRCLVFALALWIVAPFSLGAALADHGSDRITTALTDGKVNFDLRYRYEGVDQDNVPEQAKASTVRLRLGYTTGTYRHFFGFLEFEGTTQLGADSYNSTANGKTDYAPVSDPRDSELNQGYLAYAGSEGWVFKLGRQRIKLGNDRFVGNVGWRQNEQTFDAFSAKGVLTERTHLTVLFINNVNRIFGEHHPDPARADLSVDMPVAHVSHRFDYGTLTGYAHFLEIEDAPAASHRNLGLRFTGKREFSDDTNLEYTIEYADQSDYKDAPAAVDADYRLAEAGLTYRKTTFKLGYELLGGDGTYGFATPLATLHGFNGWTDKFLTTPAAGLEDLFFLVTRKVKDWKLLGVYHDFSADAGSGDFGDELGLLATRTFGEHYGIGFKYATYDAETPVFADTVDTDKFWVWLHAHN